MLWIVTSSLSLNAVRFGAHATVSLGRGLSAQHHRALLTMAVSDERAARAWLGNEDAVPAVQPPVAPMSVEEARAVLNVACEKGLVEACDALTYEEEQAKEAWLAQQDEGIAAVWGAPAAAPPAGMPTEEAPEVAATPVQPPPAAAAAPVKEELYTADGEREWVSAGETNQPAAAPAPTRSGPDTVAMEQAKAACLAKQQVPSWGPKAAVTPAPEDVAAPGAAAARAVDSLSACKEQSREEEAKAAWLAEQVPPALTPQP